MNPLFELRMVTLDDGDHVVLCCKTCDAILGPESERLGTCFVCDSQFMSKIEDFREFALRVNEFQRRTFPASTRESVVAHLKKEVDELSDSHDRYEAADCLLLLIAHADKAGYDLLSAALEKFEMVKLRKWRPVNSEGFQEHIK